MRRSLRQPWFAFAIHILLATLIVIPVYAATSIGSNISTDGNIIVRTTTGALGIGTTTPWGVLSVNPNGIAGPEFAIGSSTATHLVVTNGGNVGVGTASPSAALHILASAVATKGVIAQGVPTTTTLSYTGGQQTYVVPVGVTKVMVTALGAQGSTARVCTQAVGALGGRTKAIITVTPGETLYVYVGGAGNDYHGGYNGGGDGGSTYCRGAGGGGASDVRQGGNTITPTDNRVVVAGGGGGTGGGGVGAAGGAGGGLAGGAGGGGQAGAAASGGTQSAGGTAGTGQNNGTAGSLGQGGAGGQVNSTGGDGGGAGGGYYGGGGGGSAGSFAGGSGGGGSGFVTSTATNVSAENGINAGNGQVTVQPVVDLVEYQDVSANILSAFDTSGNLLIATTTLPAGNTKMLLSDSNQNVARLTFSGQEFYQASNTSSNGIAFLLGQNRSNNRQLWLADSANLYQNTTNGTLWFNPTTSGYSSIGARATDGSTNLNLILQPNGSNLGIGTTTPNWLLQVNGTRPSFALSDSNAAANLKHWLLSSMGGNLYIGTSTDLYATSTPSVLSLMNGGSLGISTTSPWRTLSMVGTLSLSSSLTSGTTGNYLCINTSNYEVTSGTTCSASSERFKDNIKPITYGLKEILSLNPVSFTYKKEYNPDGSTKLGFIAEQVNPILPEIVPKDKDNLPESVDYAKLAPVLTRAIQEEDAKLSALILNPGNASTILNNGATFRQLTGTLGQWRIDGDGTLTAVKIITDAMVTKALTVNDAATFGSQQKPIGITTYDLNTKQPYCVAVKSGEWVKMQGECGTSGQTSMPTSASASTPAQIPPSPPPAVPPAPAPVPAPATPAPAPAPAPTPPPPAPTPVPAPSPAPAPVPPPQTSAATTTAYTPDISPATSTSSVATSSTP